MGAGISLEKCKNIDEIKDETRTLLTELLDVAKLEPGDAIVVGCSSSEVVGHKIGSYSSEEIGDAICGTILEILDGTGIYLCAQCCEHLNRCIITEKQYARDNRIPIVNVIPQLKAGGSFATAAYRRFKEPVAVEEVSAAAGIDIGDTIIGMHLRPVAVPVRGSIRTIGEAHTVMARTRAKFIGGERAIYFKP